MRSALLLLVVSAASVTACAFNTEGDTAEDPGLGESGSGTSAGPTGGPGTSSATSTSGSPSGGGSESTDGDEETGLPPPDPACADGGYCLPAGPQGWAGPVAYAGTSLAEPPAVCPVDWTQRRTGLVDLEADEASCGCTCQSTPHACIASYSYHSNSNCMGGGTSGTVGAGGCGVVADADMYQSLEVEIEISGAASCAPETSQSVPELGWGQQLVVCEPTLGEPCPTGTCVPEPVGLAQSYCIARVDEHECPGDLYTRRWLLYDGAADDRGCSECSCEVADVSCSGDFFEYDTAMCSGGVGTQPTNGSCVDSNIPGSAGSVSYDATATAGCTQSGAMPIGAAVGTGAVTLCCTP